jgi:hypothetical protein
LLDCSCLGVIAVANAIKNTGAMTKFDISSNGIRAEGGKTLAVGLKGNQVMKELNINGNKLGENTNYEPDTPGVIAFADVIPERGALSTLDVHGNYIDLAGLKAIKKAAGVGFFRSR